MIDRITKLPLLLLLILTLLSGYGCSVINSFAVPNQQKITSMLEQHQYKNVLLVTEKQLAKQLEPDTLEYWQSIDQQVKTAAAEFEQSKASELKQLMRRNEWAQANKEIAFLNQNLPASESLDALFAEFDSERSGYLDALSRSLVKLEAKLLPQTLPLYERMFKAQPDNAAALTRLQQERDKRDRVLSSMRAYAEQAESQKEFGLALNYFRTIQRFDDSPQVLEDVKRLRGLLARQQKALIASDKLRELTTAQKQKLADYGAALSKQEWIAAKSLLDDMLKQRPSDGELLGQKTYLAEVFATEVTRAKELGESFYSTGNIEQALSIWKAALPMSPDDVQLTGNIERAERILEKVKTLKQSGSY